MQGNKKWENRIGRWLMAFGGALVGCALTESSIAGCFDNGNLVVILLAVAIYCFAELISE